MGGIASKEAFIHSHQKLLSQLSGPEAIDIADPFWTTFGQFPAQLSGLPPEEVQTILTPYWQRLIINSRSTHNFQKLVVRITGSVTNAVDQDQLLIAANGICFLKYTIKFLLEKLSGKDFIIFFEGQVLTDSETFKPGRSSLVYKLISRLLDCIVQGNIGDYSYLLKYEAIQFLIILCSSQLYLTSVPPPDDYNAEVEVLMSKREVAGVILQSLLELYVRHPLPPMSVNIYNKQNNNESSSVLRFVRHAAASFIMLPVTAYKYFVGKNYTLAFSPLSEAAQHLFLILVTYPSHLQLHSQNPYRSALESLHDMAYLGGLSPGIDTQSMWPDGTVSLSYSSLYESIGIKLVDERSTLILYLLLQCSYTFREYVLVRGDLETLLVPLCRQAYLVTSGSQSQKYLLAIIFLILTQDFSLSQNMHKIVIFTPEWYKDKSVGILTLGSFLILILIKQLHHNLLHTKDVYLHTNTIAALTNIMGTAVNLNSVACQKTIALICLLKRKYERTHAAAMVAHDDSSNTIVVFGSGTLSEPHMSLQFYEDFLRILLEVINGLITKDINGNLELTYSILQKQDVFIALEKHPPFRDLISNIKVMINFFNSHIDNFKTQDYGSTLTTERVRETIKVAGRLWRKDKLSIMPELRFTYEEEKTAEQFFIPLVWTLVVAFSDTPWKMDMITLFNSRTSSESNLDSEDTLRLETPIAPSSNDNFDV